MIARMSDILTSERAPLAALFAFVLALCAFSCATNDARADGPRYGTGGAGSWAKVLAKGNASGGTDPTLSSGDTLTSEAATDLVLTPASGQELNVVTDFGGGQTLTVRGNRLWGSSDLQIGTTSANNITTYYNSASTFQLTGTAILPLGTTGTKDLGSGSGRWATAYATKLQGGQATVGLDVTVIGGTGVSNAGGDAILSGGAGTISGTAATITASGSASGSGGPIAITSGDGATGSQNGGAIAITSGDGYTGMTGGAITITPGTASGGTVGPITLGASGGAISVPGDVTMSGSVNLGETYEGVADCVGHTQGSITLADASATTIFTVDLTGDETAVAFEVVWSCHYNDGSSGAIEAGRLGYVLYNDSGTSTVNGSTTATNAWTTGTTGTTGTLSVTWSLDKTDDNTIEVTASANSSGSGGTRTLYYEVVRIGPSARVITPQ